MEEKRVIGHVTKSATAGAGTTGTLAIVILWIAQLTQIPMDEVVAGALASLITVAGALVGGWLAKPGNGKRRADG